MWQMKESLVAGSRNLNFEMVVSTLHVFFKLSDWSEPVS